MDGAANPSFSPDDIGGTEPSPPPELRQRIPRNLGTGKFEEDDGILFRAKWAGMNQYEVDVRSGHTVWRVARCVFLVSLAVVWVALLTACIVLLARGPTDDTPCADVGHWYDTAISYQIVPASFQDSNGDGVGDIRGGFALHYVHTRHGGACKTVHPITDICCTFFIHFKATIVFFPH